ncbi:MAG: hypothetical protein V3R84_10055 [Acidimicrobiia bacterium]
MRRVMTVLVAFGLSVALAAPALAGGPPRNEDGSRKRVEVTVVGEDSVNYGLTFASIVGPDLPAHGPFQQLFPQMDGTLQTDYGPGDPGYLGGRWWIDVNGDEEMDSGDKYFSCPLLGHGSASAS